MEQLSALDPPLPIVDLAREFEDRGGPFTDAAAVLSQLDLVIGCDSGLAHLAGALGHPVWVLLSRVSDWRWLRERSDSPWYPSMRLFRQRVLHDWEEVMRRVVKAVTPLVKGRRRARRQGTGLAAPNGPPVARTDELRSLEEKIGRLRAEARACERAGDLGSRFVELTRSLLQVEEERERLHQSLSAVGS